MLGDKKLKEVESRVKHHISENLSELPLPNC